MKSFTCAVCSPGVLLGAEAANAGHRHQVATRMGWGVGGGHTHKKIKKKQSRRWGSAESTSESCRFNFGSTFLFLAIVSSALFGWRSSCRGGSQSCWWNSAEIVCGWQFLLRSGGSTLKLNGATLMWWLLLTRHVGVKIQEALIYSYCRGDWKEMICGVLQEGDTG